jgi:hypothetical protein
MLFGSDFDAARLSTFRRGWSPLEWVRGYAVLKEIGQARAHKPGVSGDDLAVSLSEAELTTGMADVPQ